MSYALARLPATFQVFEHVLKELKFLYDFAPLSYLDVGCGPGASYWAIKTAYPNLNTVSLLENNAFMYDLLKKLISEDPYVTALKQDAQSFMPLPFDFVSFSYSLGEMKDKKTLLKKYWEATKQVLILIEPGTPEGFSTILQARSFLKELGAFFIAPCGHNGPCPLASHTKDWCHFSVRVERTLVHQHIKKGNLNYEDEKFSYLIACRTSFPSLGNRILKKPLRGTGHIRLDLCTSTGIEKKTVSKSEGEVYKKAKNKEWGDVL